MNKEKLKIGIYTEDEIFEYLTEGEGSMLGRSMYDAIFDKIHALITENNQLKEKNKYLKEKIENKDRWNQLIADIGYDYDGYRKAENLMSLIDELVKYSLYARDNYEYEEFLKDSDVDEKDL